MGSRSYIKYKCEKNLYTYFKGGIFLLSAGLSPFRKALRECITKCLVGDSVETLYIKSPARQILKALSEPSPGISDLKRMKKDDHVRQ